MLTEEVSKVLMTRNKVCDHVRGQVLPEHTEVTVLQQVQSHDVIHLRNTVLDQLYLSKTGGNAYKKETDRE